MSKSKLQQIKDALIKAIPINKGLDLYEDVFLTGKELDGSDKIYGFYKDEDNEIYVVSRSSSGYPISDLDTGDINYIMSYILDKIKANKYDIVEINNL